MVYFDAEFESLLSFFLIWEQVMMSLTSDQSDSWFEVVSILNHILLSVIKLSIETIILLS